ncbi:hypothetical protein D3C80_2187990 [compost metagenome]
MKSGDTLAVLHINETNETASQVAERVREAYSIGEEKPAPRSLLLSVVTKEGINRY